MVRGVTLVFDTLRTGFPTAEIVIFDNANSELVRSELRDAFKKLGQGWFLTHIKEEITHHEWIKRLVNTSLATDGGETPFFICDTDVIFWKSMEKFKFGDAAIAGRKMPRFKCEFTRCITQPRLHTSLLYINAKRIQQELATYTQAVPPTIISPLVDMFAPFYFQKSKGDRFEPGESIFYDTCGMLFNHVSHTAFEDKHLNCYDHLHCATYTDLAEQRGHPGITERHKEIYANPTKAKGIWRQQEKYLAHYAC